MRCHSGCHFDALGIRSVAFTSFIAAISESFNPKSNTNNDEGDATTLIKATLPCSSHGVEMQLQNASCCGILAHSA